ncbi:MAG: hypothetical protein K2X69_13895 [Silvanigrellaceae bacterium]|nr:hypothetical protein [Silvanigrellaceae bacterium]
MKFSTKVALGLFTIAGLTAIYYGDNYYTQKKKSARKKLLMLFTLRQKMS